MKRRTAAFILCVLLALQLSFPPARAADRVYFTAAGSYIMPLSDNTMPFWSGGYVYIPSSLFTGTGRESLSVSQVLDSSLEWVVLYSGSNGRSLTFYLDDNRALDNAGTVYYPGAIVRNGTVFVPARTVSQYFDLAYSVIEVDKGSLVWLRPQWYNTSDKIYADAAQYSLNTVYADYIRAKESAQPGGGSSGTSSRPNSPGEEPDPDNQSLEGKRIALCLEGGSAAAIAEVLAGFDAGAAFFFTPEEMEQQGDVLRRLTASGQSVGILADANDPERTVAEQLEAGNAALFQATCGKTRLALVQNGGSQSLQTAAELGYRCLQPEMDVQSLRSHSDAQSLVQRLAARRGDAVVWLGGGASPAGVRPFLTAVQEAGGLCPAYTELGLL